MSVPEHIIFTKMAKNLSFQSIAIFSCQADFTFCRSGDHRLKIYFRSSRNTIVTLYSSSPPAASQRASQASIHGQRHAQLLRPPLFQQSQFHAECPMSLLVPAWDPHFHSPPVPEPPFSFYFAAAHTYHNMGWVPPPPPPPPRAHDAMYVQ